MKVRGCKPPTYVGEIFNLAITLGTINARILLSIFSKQFTIIEYPSII